MQQRRAVRRACRPPTRATPVAEIDRVADARALGVAHERPPVARPLALVQRRADPRLAAPPFELGRDHPGIVEHQHVARPQQSRQVEHRRSEISPPVDQQQPRRFARPRRAAARSSGGSSKSKQVDAHCGAAALRSRPTDRTAPAAPHRLPVGRGRRSAGGSPGGDPVDRVHARDHPAEDGIFIVETRGWART